MVSSVYLIMWSRSPDVLLQRLQLLNIFQNIEYLLFPLSKSVYYTERIHMLAPWVDGLPHGV